MSYIIYSKTHGVIGKADCASVDDVSLRDGEIAIPCTDNADLNDEEQWQKKAELMLSGQYAPTVEDARALKRHELLKLRDKAIAEGFLHTDGHTYPISPDVQIQMLTMFQGSQAMPAPGYSWKDTNGIYQTIGNAEAFQAFCVTAMGYGQSLYAREEMLQSYVNELDDIEAIGTVHWGTVPELPAP